jgi:hypothetical protein
MRILLIGGFSDNKIEKAKQLIIDKCNNKNIKAEIIYLNSFKEDIYNTIEKERPDIIIKLIQKELNLSIPVVNGLPFIYPQLGVDKAIDEILKYTSQTQ